MSIITDLDDGWIDIKDKNGTKKGEGSNTGIEFNCGVEHKLKEKWEEVFDSPGLIRNKSGEIEIDIGLTLEFNYSILDLFLPFFWEKLKDLSGFEVDLKTEATFEVEAFEINVDERRYLQKNLDKSVFEWNTDEVEAGIDEGSFVSIIAHCDCNMIIDFLTSTGIVPGNGFPSWVEPCLGGGDLVCRFEPFKYFFSIRYFVREKPGAPGIYQIRSEQPEWYSSGEFSIVCEGGYGADPPLFSIPFDKYEGVVSKLNKPAKNTDWTDIDINFLIVTDCVAN